MSVIVKGGGGGKSSGLYVWSRYVVGQAQASISLREINHNPVTLQLSSYDVDYSTLTADDLVGVTGQYTYLDTFERNFSIISNSEIIFSSLNNGKPFSYTYNPNNGQISVDTSHTASYYIHFVSVSDITIEKKTLENFVVNDDSSAYPNGGYKNGYWYELYGLPFKIVTWAGGTDEEIVAMVEAADQGIINLSDYWAVGDTRTVQLSAMSATGVGESHSAQEVDLVLMHAGGYELADGSTCNFVVGQKDSLAAAGYINSSSTNSGSWDGSARRTWCNSVYKNALPITLLPIFKQFKTITAETYNGSSNQESVDYFALPAEKEVFGSRKYSNQTEFNALFQFDYYKTTSNRVKKRGKTGSASHWWERSPLYNDSGYFCFVYSDGKANGNSAESTYGLAPFGCI